jgi:glutamate synthase domain-containing protein 3
MVTNYFNEQSPKQQEEQRRLDEAIAEAKRYRKLAEDVEMFESLQRQLKREAKLKPIEQKPLLEEIMLARGLLRAEGPIKNE